ncbi:hypothetical protein WMY93_001625 [Mugilogobius chulae]|uniref:Uncharacterized protein n=1 Tax=Mugilogobius chulae TaxID=88201 RepID=A0AAW0PUR2_9GOBI
MAAAKVRALLQSCDPQLLDVCGDSDHTDAADASRMVLFLMDSRRVQKVLWRQLFVLHSMVSLMEELKSARQLLTQPSPAPPDGGARSRWKTLKLQYKTSLEETENLLRTQLQKIQQIHEKRQRLSQLLQSLHKQDAHSHTLQDALLTAHNALQRSEEQLQQLRAQAEVTAGHMIDWERIRDERLLPPRLEEKKLKPAADALAHQASTP